MKRTISSLLAALFLAAASWAAPQADISEKTVQAQTVLAVHSKTTPGDLSTVLSRDCRRVMAFLQMRGLEPAGPPVAVFRKLDAKEIEVDVGYVVTANIRPDSGLQLVTLPAGRTAALTAKTVYSDLPLQHAALKSWMSAQKKSATGNPWITFPAQPSDTSGEYTLYCPVRP